MKGFGIHVTLIEPGGFSTDWAGPSAKHATPIDAYDDVREANKSRATATNRGNPAATGPVILKLVDADEPPLRAFFGTVPLSIATKDYESRLATWNQWQWLAEEAQGD